MITLSELQMKEIVLMQSGRRLGFIDDLEINEQTGLITKLIIVNRPLKGAFFSRPEERTISWDQIVTIGADIILVNDMQETIQSSTEID